MSGGRTGTVLKVEVYQTFCPSRQGCGRGDGIGSLRSLRSSLCCVGSLGRRGVGAAACGSGLVEVGKAEEMVVEGLLFLLQLHPEHLCHLN